MKVKESKNLVDQFEMISYVKQQLLKGELSSREAEIILKDLDKTATEDFYQSKEKTL